MAELHGGHGPERVHTENVVLDIGGNVGALIIYTGPAWCGREIELSLRANGAGRVHNQVHERHFNGHTLFAAVYPALQAGEYDIWGDEATCAGTVTVAGGQVAIVDWRDQAPTFS